MSQNLSQVLAPGDHLDVPRGVTIRLRVTEAERDAMKASADREGITLSEWVRQRCFIITTTVQIKDATIPTVTPSSRARGHTNRATARRGAAALKGRGK